MKDPGGVLGRILAQTRADLRVRRRSFPLDRLMASAPTPRGQRSFREALARSDRVNVIAEFKRRSPSRGSIREDLHPVRVAQAYEIGGAAALSILTEEHFFGGRLDDLQEARAATLLPALRKDFLVDPYQVWEAWFAGADAVLLIVAALEDDELNDLKTSADEARLDALFEVRDAEELQRALRAGARLIGVNNRDLRTLEVRPETGLSLAPLIPDHVIAVAESGFRNGDDIARFRDAGYDAFLVGEHLMSAEDPGAALQTLIGEAESRGAPSRHHVTVKICGITSVEDGLAAVRAGAEAIGLVFWAKSPRCVSIDQAKAIAAALPPFVLRVGVFVDAKLETLRRTANSVGLDLLQLHGQEPPEAFDTLPRRGIKAIPVGPDFRIEELARYQGRAAGVLLDAGGASAPGGTGRTFDWALAASARERASSLILAGGLTPDNVGNAIRAVRPDGVDVSSGVEAAPGRKDAAKMRAFIQAVRKAER